MRLNGGCGRRNVSLSSVPEARRRSVFFGEKPERTGPEKHETWTCLTAGEETGSGFLHNVAISDSSVATQTVTDG